MHLTADLVDFVALRAGDVNVNETFVVVLPGQPDAFGARFDLSRRFFENILPDVRICPPGHGGERRSLAFDLSSETLHCLTQSLVKILEYEPFPDTATGIDQGLDAVQHVLVVSLLPDGIDGE